MIGRCPWSLDAFTYAGLCSHSPLSEGAAGNFDLTAEQLEALVDERKEHAKAYRKEYVVLNQEHIREYGREHAKERRQDENVRIQDRINARNAYARTKKTNAQKLQDERKRAAQKVLVSKRWWCDACKVNCVKQGDYDEHIASGKHQRTIARSQSGVLPKYWCKLCSVGYDHKHQIERHNNGPRHIKRAAGKTAAGKAAASKAAASKAESSDSA